MAEATPKQLSSQPPPAEPEPEPAAGGWRSLIERLRRPGAVQFGALAGLAAVLAVLVAAWLWLGSSRYEPLYSGLAESDAGEVMEALQQNDIPYKVDRRSGALLVAAEQVHEARLKLAAQGLPRGAVDGFELLGKQDSFGLSETMQQANLHRALEGELARTVMSVGAVQQARVHLAIPEETVFVRERKPRTASVLVQLYPGRVLSEGQVAAIVHLVSSSVPKLAPDQVSVIDQAGNLLTRPGRDPALAMSMDQMDYRRRLEEDYIRKIESIVEPIVGQGRVRAQVALDVDFTRSEQTAEQFQPGPEQGLVRSEQLLEEMNARPRPGGIPGALSNEPPGVAEAPEQLPEAPPDTQPAPTDAQVQADTGRGVRTRKESTRNYELNKTISHTRNAPGRIARVSAAVVLDDRLVADAEGVLKPTPLPPEELERITALVRQAVGFDEQRGDTVNVMNAAFAASTFVTAPLPLWQEPWFLELVKLAALVLIALLVLLLVVRPLIKRLLPEPAKKPEPEPAALEGPDEEDEEVIDDRSGDYLSKDDPAGYEGLVRKRMAVELLDKRLRLAKTLVAEDPKRAVQVIKTWIADET